VVCETIAFLTLKAAHTTQTFRNITLTMKTHDFYMKMLIC